MGDRSLLLLLLVVAKPRPQGILGAEDFSFQSSTSATVSPCFRAASCTEISPFRMLVTSVPGVSPSSVEGPPESRHPSLHHLSAAYSTAS
jgi:hypothetical protein